jgi:alpha-mannosidase
VTESSLENARYRVQLNQDGDVSSIYDKSLSKELLSAPIRLAISTMCPSSIRLGIWISIRSRQHLAPT